MSYQVPRLRGRLSPTPFFLLPPSLPPYDTLLVVSTDYFHAVTPGFRHSSRQFLIGGPLVMFTNHDTRSARRNGTADSEGRNNTAYSQFCFYLQEIVTSRVDIGFVLGEGELAKWLVTSP